MAAEMTTKTNDPRQWPLSVLGCGAWGTTLALHLHGLGHRVTLWAHDAALAEEMAKSRRNRLYLPEAELPRDMLVTANLSAALDGALALVVAVASQHYAALLDQLPPAVLRRALFISATKGLDTHNGATLSQLFAKRHPDLAAQTYLVLSGPNLATEILHRRPTAAVVASLNEERCRAAQELLSSPAFRVYTNSDVIGVELGGSLKNIMAIAAGILDGLEYGDNAKATLLVRGAREIARLGHALGARPETFMGLSGMGDLIATCGSRLSRNHTVGERIGRGETLSAILSSMTAVAEGVNTARAAKMIAERAGVEMPITREINRILFEDKDPRLAIDYLMTRTLKAE